MGHFNILDYGAVEGTLCTQAVQEAFREAGERQGTVVIPAGTYKTGAVNMHGASLLLDKGARLLASDRIEDYPPFGYVQTEMGEVRSLLYCMDESGITVSGEGVIDLSGDAFYDFGKREIPKSKVPFTPEQVEECTATYIHRPNQPILFLRCKNIRLRDITIVNAPSWTLSFTECEDIHVTDLTIDNNLSIPNCDGMHFSACDGVFVRGCNISAGDDCVALTCLTDWDRPCRRVVISDCVFRSCSKAISVGYMHRIVRDVTISNCVILESNRAIVLMANPGTGLVENIVLSNLRLDTRIRAGNWWGNGEPVCIMGTCHDNPAYYKAPPAQRFAVGVRNILIQNIICSGENAMAVVGEKNSVQGVRFSNVVFTLKDSANLPLKGRTIDIAPGEQTAVMPEDGIAYWLFLKQVRDISVTEATVHPFHGQTPRVYLEDCEKVTLHQR